MADSLRNVGGRGFLDGSEDDDLYTIHGIAIGAGDITLGSKSGERKYWGEDVLREGASTLEGKQIVANHENRDIYSVVGNITDASYSEERGGVVFQGVVDEELLAKRINRGWLDVSPRIIHTKGEVDERGIKHPEKIRRFDNLSLVSKGAAPSNEVDIGEAEEMSVEELQSCFDNGPEVEDAEFEKFEELQEDDIKYEKYLYNNPEGAEGASQGFGCEGYHKHDIDGATWYMPCENHDKFLANLKERRANGNEEASQSECNGDCGSIEESSSSEEIVENEEFVDEFSTGEKEEYSSEEMRIASQMSSYSEMTKGECLSLVDMVHPSRETDIPSMVKVLQKVLSDDEREAMARHMVDSEKGSDKKQSSVLNRIVQ